jgi:hypothetical protein
MQPKRKKLLKAMAELDEVEELACQHPCAFETVHQTSSQSSC